MALAGCSGDVQDSAAQDTTTEITYSNVFGRYRSPIYVPAYVGRTAPAPLVVMLHGANTTAKEMRAFGLIDPLARREGFIVMYPDHETDGALGLHPLQSWRSYDPLETPRGVGDAEALAELTLQAMQC